MLGYAAHDILAFRNYKQNPLHESERKNKFEEEKKIRKKKLIESFRLPDGALLSFWSMGNCRGKGYMTGRGVPCEYCSPNFLVFWYL